jgi:hypothetical protein
MDEAFGEWALGLRDDERWALRRYQDRDGTYKVVNGVLRGTVRTVDLPESARDEVADIIACAGTAIDAGRCPSDIVVWRGVDDTARTFGTADPPGQLDDVERRFAGFLSCTTRRQVALDHFTERDRGALLELHVPAGTPGAWLPLAGDPNLAYEAELLLGEDTLVRVIGHRHEGGFVVLVCEVTA